MHKTFTIVHSMHEKNPHPSTESDVHNRLQLLQEVLNTHPPTETKERVASREKPPKKTIFCFVGLPGVGKTTQIENIRIITGADTFHLGKFAKELPIEHTTSDQTYSATPVNTEALRKTGDLIAGLDEIFLDTVNSSHNKTIILDGFPRSPKQAEDLYTYATSHDWDIQIVHLQFSEDAIQQSFQRQVARAQKEGKEIDTERFLGKLTRAVEKDMAALQTLATMGIDVAHVTATQSPDIIFNEIREHLGLDFESLQWERATLQTVYTASKELGIEAWCSAGILYRPFFNGQYGPMQESTDKDVFIYNQADVVPFRKKLEEIDPDTRWSVHSRTTESKRHLGITPDTLSSGILNVPLTFRQGGVRMTENGLEVNIKPSAEADLRNGILRLDEDILAQMPPAERATYIQDAVARVRKTLSEYPGLSLRGTLAEVYKETYGQHQPAPIISSWDEIQEEVWEAESGGRLFGILIHLQKNR